MESPGPELSRCATPRLSSDPPWLADDESVEGRPECG